MELIQDLLVFPATLTADDPLKLRVDYTNADGNIKSIFVNVAQGQWEAGKTYSYTFMADLATLE